jgi:hypothetical protein
MFLLRWLVWPLLLVPVFWWGWHALHAPPPGLTLDNGAKMVWGDCWFDKPLWRPINCGRFQTAPVQDSTPTQFSLPVIHIPRPPWVTAGAPTQYIAGGPGGAAWLEPGEIGFWLDWVDANDWAGDLIVYDQRGVGLSEPALACPELRDLRRELLPLPLPSEEAYRRVRDVTRACHDRLREEGYALNRFTTTRNAADAVDLMRAIGFQQWNVYGVSYGTRVALEMMRTVPMHCVPRCSIRLIRRRLTPNSAIRGYCNAPSSCLAGFANWPVAAATARRCWHASGSTTHWIVCERELLRLSVRDPDERG